MVRRRAGRAPPGRGARAGERGRGQMGEAKDPGQTHILVVNDTPEILELFRELLEGEGYRVSLYSYAFRDLDEIKRAKPDLLILDFIIGGEDHGWQLLQKLKMDRATADLPVIVCTAAVGVVRELEGRLREKNV